MNEEFWRAIDRLVEESEIITDRPKGSAHPRYPHIVYEVAYGYLKNTQSADGAGIDVWIGSDGNTAVGVICTVDLVKRDSEIKILLGCNQAETDYICRFHNRSENMKGVLIRR